MKFIKNPLFKGVTKYLATGGMALFLFLIQLTAAAQYTFDEGKLEGDMILTDTGVSNTNWMLQIGIFIIFLVITMTVMNAGKRSRS